METEIELLVTSDVHGYLYPTTYRDRSEKPLGLAKIATLIKRKSEQRNILLLDNGDIIQGSPLTYYHAKKQRAQSNPVIKAANTLGYAASVLGNHEFNYGLEYLQQAAAEADYPLLAANILNEQTGEPFFGTPYITREINSVKLVVLGITTHYIPNWEEPKNIAGLKFEDALETAKQWVKQIREKETPDVMIVSYHGGFERDLKTGEPTEPLTGENQGWQMCQELNIDVLITGHQHRSIATELNGITVIQPGNNGRMLGEIKLKLEQSDGSWVLKEAVPKLTEVDATVDSDPALSALLADFENETQSWLDQPIGTIDGDMAISDPLKTRMEDTPLIEFINKVQMEAAGTAIANTALFNNDSTGFKRQVTMRDIVSNYIYPNTLNVIRLSGRDIKDALEKSAEYFILKDGQITVNPTFIEPKPQHYNYDMWEGIDYELKISNPVGERVTFLNFNGTPVDPKGEYDVVMNNYRAGGAGGFDMFQGKPVIKDIPVDMTELIANYILARKKITATCDGNWQVTK